MKYYTENSHQRSDRIFSSSPWSSLMIRDKSTVSWRQRWRQEGMRREVDEGRNKKMKKERRWGKGESFIIESMLLSSIPLTLNVRLDREEDKGTPPQKLKRNGEETGTISQRQRSIGDGNQECQTRERWIWKKGNLHTDVLIHRL